MHNLSNLLYFSCSQQRKSVLRKCGMSRFAELCDQGHTRGPTYPGTQQCIANPFSHQELPVSRGTIVHRRKAASSNHASSTSPVLGHLMTIARSLRKNKEHLGKEDKKPLLTTRQFRQTNLKLNLPRMNKRATKDASNVPIPPRSNLSSSPQLPRSTIE